MAHARKRARRGGGKGRPRRVTFGYFEKEEAVRIGRGLQGAGIPCRVGLDREFARRHRSATAFNPALHRARSHRDVTMGYFVRVPAAYEGITRKRLAEAGVSPETTDGEGVVPGKAPEFDADPRWCPHCLEEMPPQSETCSECGRPTVDILQRAARRQKGLPLWMVLLVLAVLLAVAAARLF